MKNLSVILILSIIMFLGGCGSSQLSDKYSEQVLKESTEEIISYLNNENFEAIVDRTQENLKNQLTVEVLQEAWSNFDDIGEYDSISKMVFQEKDNIATVIALAKYSNRDIQYTISYNTEMELVGFYLK
ncbi:DUF3887 domain-containing protein [Alkalibaculum sp. M08DMB]|uniref:DUF3887 domain-containing protein n=1 Tax=Alkalibaculum sporogenes TaxID=2655001 RepID=A0A6A7K4X2_9FIRM|nr:DUF3887 domain-containing protein [Alkalibaculum sporogenes]MPW24438.1 DUF3887 domain-containing protein [Alkalibaculum sporogenes]